MLEVSCRFNGLCQSQVRWPKKTFLFCLFYSQCRAFRVRGTGKAVHLPRCLWSIILVSLSKSILVVPELLLQLFSHHASLAFEFHTQVYRERLGLLDYPYSIFVLGVCICSCVYVWVPVPTHIYVCGAQRSRLEICPLSFKDPLMSSSELGLKVHATMPSFLWGWDLILRVSILPTEPSSHPHKIYCFVFLWALFALGNIYFLIILLEGFRNHWSSFG